MEKESESRLGGLEFLNFLSHFRSVGLQGMNHYAQLHLYKVRLPEAVYYYIQKLANEAVMYSLIIRIHPEKCVVRQVHHCANSIDYTYTN